MPDETTAQNWSAQSSPNEETSSGGAPSVLLSNAAGQGYLGWSGMASDAISTFSPVSATTYLTRIFVPEGGTTSKLDVWSTTVGTVSAAYFGLYNSAGAQIAATAESHTAWAAGRNALSWTSSVPVQGGNFYFVAANLTWSVQPVVTAMTVSAVQNLNLSSGNYNFSTGPNNTVPLPASYTLTGWTASAGAPIWVAIY